MKKHLTFYEYRGFEHSGKIVTDISLTGLSKSELAKLQDLSDQMSKGEIFTINGNTIKANNYVGIVTFGNVQIEILPKLLGSGSKSSMLSNLSFMLSRVYDSPVFDFNLGSIDSSRGSFLEAYISIFATKLLSLSRRGLPKTYVRLKENSSLAKGKISVYENIKTNALKPHHLICEFDEFSPDNKLNQLLKQVAKHLIPLTNLECNRKTLREVLVYLTDISETSFTFYDVKDLKVERQKAEFVAVFELAKFFLKGIRHEVNSGSHTTFSIIFDMNELYEKFVFHLIQANKRMLGVSKVYCQSKKKLLEGYENMRSGEKVAKKMMDTYLDIFVEFSDGRKLIIDTKYKVLKENGDNHFNISNADIYQVNTYRGLHTSVSIPNISLFYPQNKSALALKLNLRGDLHPIHVFTLNLHSDLRMNLTELICELKDCLIKMTEEDLLAA